MFHSPEASRRPGEVVEIPQWGPKCPGNLTREPGNKKTWSQATFKPRKIAHSSEDNTKALPQNWEKPTIHSPGEPQIWQPTPALGIPVTAPLTFTLTKSIKTVFFLLLLMQRILGLHQTKSLQPLPQLFPHACTYEEVAPRVAGERNWTCELRGVSPL